MNDSHPTPTAPGVQHRPLLSLRRPEPEPRWPHVGINGFYFVWSPDRARPRQRHATADAALAEAARLAALNPDVEFLVYEARLVPVAP